MELKHNNIVIREAVLCDAPQLCRWWNDGAVMAHAGFPKGLGITCEAVQQQISRSKGCLYIILLDGIPIGEMNYNELAEDVCEIGIKICEAQHQNKGYGKVILSLFLTALFARYRKVHLDTNLTNLRAQHVYEQLGFQKTCVRHNAWRDQLGQFQSSVEYELTEDVFHSFL